MLFLKDVNYVSCLVQVLIASHLQYVYLHFITASVWLFHAIPFLKEIVQLRMADSGIRSPP